MFCLHKYVYASWTYSASGRLPCVFWGSNPGPVEQPKLFTAEPSFQPLLTTLPYFNLPSPLKLSCPISTYLYSISVKVTGKASEIQIHLKQFFFFLIEIHNYLSWKNIMILIIAEMLERSGLEVCCNTSSILWTLSLEFWKALYLSALM